VVREFDMLRRLFALWGNIPFALSIPIHVPIPIFDPGSIPIAIGAGVSVEWGSIESIVVSGVRRRTRHVYTIYTSKELGNRNRGIA
jgi:hypothetical protein